VTPSPSYRGTSLIGSTPLLEPYSRTILGVLWWSEGVLFLSAWIIKSKSMPSRKRCPPPRLPPYIPHPTPYTSQPTPYALHLTPYTLQPTAHILHPTPYTLHPTSCILHLSPYTLHPAPYTLLLLSRLLGGGRGRGQDSRVSVSIGAFFKKAIFSASQRYTLCSLCMPFDIWLLDSLKCLEPGATTSP
jgi:hypothetical protein